MNSAEAVERLRDGNRRYVAGKTTRSSTIDPAERAELAGGQSPFAVILSCSDSRVPVELVFDRGAGDLFVIRVAGNVATPTQIGSIEYAVSQLGAQLVVVLGHDGCGAVAAAIESVEQQSPLPSPNLEAIVDEIRPALESLRDLTLNDAVLANVRRTIDNLGRRSPLLEQAIADGNVTVTGAIYSLETGGVSFIE